jgi:hypothetical protein
MRSYAQEQFIKQLIEYYNKNTKSSLVPVSMSWVDFRSMKDSIDVVGISDVLLMSNEMIKLGYQMIYTEDFIHIFEL